MWTEKLNNDERKILLNRLLQEDDIAFSIYLENINEPYDVIKARLIDQFTECDESLSKSRKEKKQKKKIFKKMSKDEMQEYVRTKYNELNTLSKERLVMRELARSLPRKFKKMDLENKCTSVDQMIEVLSEKFGNMKMKESSVKDGEKKKHKHHFKLRRLRRRSSSSSSSSSSDSSGDERGKKDHHHKKHHHREHDKHHKV